MRIKLISDAHSNYPALKKAVENKDNEDMSIYLGDIIGLMGFPSETTNLIKSEFDIAIKGNHDISVLEYNEGHVNDQKLSQIENDYTHKKLNHSQKEWIQSLPTIKELNNPNETLIAHAYPTKDKSSGIKELSPSERSEAKSKLGYDIKCTSIGGVMPSDFTKIASKFDYYKYLFLGHTHRQHYLDASKFGHNILITNPGSIGQSPPFTYSIVDTKDNTVEEKKVEVSKSKIQQKLREEGIPTQNIF